MVAWQYEVWTGRFAGTLAYGLIAYSADVVRDYRWVQAVAFVIASGALFGANTIVLGGQPLRNRVLIVVSLLFLFAVNQPSPDEWLYWVGSAYLCFVAGCLLALGGAVAYRMQDCRTTVGAVTAAGAASVCMSWAGASYEPFIFPAFILLATLLARAKAVDRRLLLTCLVATSYIVTIAVVLLAPGNALRQSASTGRSFLAATGLTVFHGVFRLSDWLASPVLLGLSLIALPILGQVQQVPWWTRYLKRDSHYLIVPVVLVLVPLAMVGVSFLHAGAAAGRVWNLAYMVFVLTWFASMRLVGHRLRWLWGRVDPWQLRAVGLAVFLVGALGTSHFQELVKDLVLRATGYQQQLRARYALIAAAKPGAALTVPALENIPKTIYMRDISSDGSYFGNTCYAKYFGLSSIRTDHPNEVQAVKKL